jgi:hypothetical protein
MTFMQGQLRALWVDQPQVTGELPAVDESAGRHGTTAVEAVVPQQRQPVEDSAEEHREPAEEAETEPVPSER